MDPMIDQGDNPTTGALVILAHGAGQDAASPFMTTIARGLAQRGIDVWRFNFPYMADRVAGKSKRPPDRQPVLLASWNQVIDEALNAGYGPGSIIIGGKSLGGRIATMVATERDVGGVVSLGYPFHPPGKADRLRTEHLASIQSPVLICQGERDTFGNRDEVPGYRLPDHFDFFWLADGDHSFKPRKKSGFTLEQHLESTVDRINGWIRAIISP